MITLHLHHAGSLHAVATPSDRFGVLTTALGLALLHRVSERQSHPHPTFFNLNPFPYSETRFPILLGRVLGTPLDTANTRHSHRRLHSAAASSTHSKHYTSLSPPFSQEGPLQSFVDSHKPSSSLLLLLLLLLHYDKDPRTWRCWQPDFSQALPNLNADLLFSAMRCMLRGVKILCVDAIPWVIE